MHKTPQKPGVHRRKTPISRPKSGVVEYYGYRDYDPKNGRWSTRDPIAEQGGLNIYGMVGNDAVFRFDEFGLSWRKTWSSSGDARRVICSNDLNDTKQDLADAAGLDVADFKKWAIPTKYSKQRSDGLYCCYTIPNTWIAADFLTGSRPYREDGFTIQNVKTFFGKVYDKLVNLGGTLGIFFGTDMATYGYKVVKPKSGPELLSNINKDTWGLVVFGHGGPDDEVIADGGRNVVIKQSTIRNYLRKNTNFKISKAYMMQCYSANGTNRTEWAELAMYVKTYNNVNVLTFDVNL